MGCMCGWYGISRQAHYQMSWHQQQQHQAEEQILDLVRAIRHKHNRMGGRKLYHQMQPQLLTRGIQIGRDRFFDLLRAHDLLLRPKKRAYRTTWAGSWRCENLLGKPLSPGPIKPGSVISLTWPLKAALST